MLFSTKSIITFMSVSQPATPWPHAPTHQLSENGTHFVTAGTYLKAHHFHTPQRLDVLQLGLLSVARDFSWEARSLGNLFESLPLWFSERFGRGKQSITEARRASHAHRWLGEPAGQDVSAKGLA